jgi:NADPH:quinone reductase-like Zn-dependent oxidoreductase
VKAFVLQSYGSAERLQLRDIDRPEPAADEVLVRVRATSVNPYDWHNMRGEPYIARLMPGGLGLRMPKLSILGCDMAGRVEAVGADVTGFAPGDDVFALLEQGGFAEYVCVPERLLAQKPATASFEQAAAMPMAAVTALLGLRKVGGIRAGQRVLVTGASGGVGAFAVQVAKAFGAEVTGVCGPRNVELVRSLGADVVIDYTIDDFTTAPNASGPTASGPTASGPSRYDLLLDCAGTRPTSAMRQVLTPEGVIVLVGGPGSKWVQPAGRAIGAILGARLFSRRVVMVDTVGHEHKKVALETLARLVDEGKVTPVIGRRYAFDDIPAAVAYQEEGHSTGKVVVTV